MTQTLIARFVAVVKMVHQKTHLRTHSHRGKCPLLVQFVVKYFLSSDRKKKEKITKK